MVVREASRDILGVVNKLFSFLLAGLLTATMARAADNLKDRDTTAAARSPDADDPADKEYRKLMEDDDEAHQEVDRWIREAQEFAAKGAKGALDTLSGRVKERLAPVRKAYEEFIVTHPKHAKVRIAFGSFLNDLGEETAAVDQWEKALEVDPTIPSIYNNLANYYGHHGPVRKAFEYYGKAMNLRTNESVYCWNLATTIYLFRKDAMDYYTLDETGVFDKALDYYRQALRLDPTNFILAADYSESFYGTKPPRWKDGLAAWEDTLKIAKTDVEREGVHVHFARIKLKLGKLEEAQRDLNGVTNEMYAALKATLQKNINAARTKATNAAVDTPAGTNSPPAEFKSVAPAK